MPVHERAVSERTLDALFACSDGTGRVELDAQVEAVQVYMVPTPAEKDWIDVPQITLTPSSPPPPPTPPPSPAAIPPTPAPSEAESDSPSSPSIPPAPAPSEAESDSSPEVPTPQEVLKRAETRRDIARINENRKGATAEELEEKLRPPR